MSDNQHFYHDDLALFAMQLLSKDEAADIKALLKSSPELQHELAEVQGDLAIYASTVDVHSPPALARERLLTEVGRERKVRSIDRSQEPVNRVAIVTSHTEGSTDRYPRTETSRLTQNDRDDLDDLPEESSTLGRIVPWLGWAVAAALAVTTGNFYHESQAMRGSMASEHAELTRLSADAAAARRLMETLKDPTATRVTLTPSKQAPVPQGKVTYVADKGSLLFVASNLEPLQTYKVYELWLIPANGQAPVPAGTFHPDARGNASLVLPRLPSGLVAKAFGITVEDEGGSETPTMPIILSGSAAGA